MAQDLTVNIKTTSDVPQAMDKAKSATVSFEKQVTDISRKFSTAFKDIAFSLVAPVVLLNSAISYIQGAMEQARRDAKEGLDLIAQGESRFATSEETKAAAFFKRKKEIDDEIKLVKSGREEIAKQILENQNGQFKDFVLPEKYNKQLASGSITMAGLSQDKEIQRLAVEYFNKTDAGKRILESMGETTKTGSQSTYSAPQGVNAVVGVGSNAAMQAMIDTLDENRKQTALLQQIANGGGNVPVDFTKDDPHVNGYNGQM